MHGMHVVRVLVAPCCREPPCIMGWLASLCCHLQACFLREQLVCALHMGGYAVTACESSHFAHITSSHDLQCVTVWLLLPSAGALCVPDASLPAGIAGPHAAAAPEGRRCTGQPAAAPRCDPGVGFTALGCNGAGEQEEVPVWVGSTVLRGAGADWAAGGGPGGEHCQQLQKGYRQQHWGRLLVRRVVVKVVVKGAGEGLKQRVSEDGWLVLWVLCSGALICRNSCDHSVMSPT
jgi:hypothetical protein